MINKVFPPFIGAEAAVKIAMRDLLGPGDVAFDVGANIGTLSVFMAELVKASGHVHAFEPNEKCRKRIASLLKAKDINHCTVIPKAVSELSDQSIDFYLDERPEMNGGASTIMPELANPDRLGTKSVRNVRVSTISLDHYCASAGICPHFVKFDIEGAELLALAGFRKGLERFRPHMILEFASEGNGRQDTSLQFLEGLGYALIDLNTYYSGTSREFSDKTLFGNILAIHREKKHLTPYGHMSVKEFGIKHAGDLNFRDKKGEVLGSEIIMMDRGRYVASFLFAASGNPEIEIAVSADNVLLSNTGGYADILNWSPNLVFEIDQPKAKVCFSMKRLSEGGALSFDKLHIKQIVFKQ